MDERRDERQGMESSADIGPIDAAKRGMRIVEIVMAEVKSGVEELVVSGGAETGSKEKAIFQSIVSS